MSQKFGGTRIYNKAFKNRDDVILWEAISVRNEEIVKFIFEETKSLWQQGIWIMSDLGVEVNHKKAESMILWYDNAPKIIEVKCFTQNGSLNFYNVWNRGQGMQSQSFSSGMIVEELQNGRRYYCNDIGFETEFKKLVFRIERG